MHPRYQALLEDFAEHADVSIAGLLERQHIAVRDVQFELHCEATDPDQDSGDVIFYTLFPPPEPDNERAMYRLALQANMLWSGTGGLTMAVVERTGQLMLCGYFPIADLDGLRFARVLDHAAGQAQAWLEKTSFLQCSGAASTNQTFMLKA